MKPKHIQLYLDLATRIATESYAKRLQVGCVLVKDENIISFGYNGTPPDWCNDCEENNATRPEVLHAEENAILKLSKTTGNSNNAYAFCTHSCCMHCAKMLYRSGISKFYYLNSYRDTQGVDFLQKAGVEVIKYYSSDVVSSENISSNIRNY